MLKDFLGIWMGELVDGVMYFYGKFVERERLARAISGFDGTGRKCWRYSGVLRKGCCVE